MHRATVHLHHEFDQRARAVTTVIGEIDASTAPTVAAHLARQTVQPDIVDCRYVSFMGAAGLRVLVEAQRRHQFDTVASMVVERVADLCGLRDCLRLTVAAGPPALHRSALAVAEHDPQLRFVYVNDALAAVNGLPAQAHYGQRIGELFETTRDELTPLLCRVLDSRSPRRIVVKGTTAGSEDTSWQCSYHAVRYRSEAGPAAGVVATVAANRQPHDPPGDGTARLEFGLRQSA